MIAKMVNALLTASEMALACQFEAKAKEKGAKRRLNQLRASRVD
jgi:hypothetical protein